MDRPSAHRLSDADRALVDQAVAAGRVTLCAAGVAIGLSRIEADYGLSMREPVSWSFRTRLSNGGHR